MDNLLTVTQNTMERSYTGISFSPEKRGAGDFIYYNALLKEDLESLGERYGKHHYINKFNEMLGNVVASRGNLISSMITGPANFPFRSNQKKCGYYENHLSKFDHFRTKAINKSNAKRTLSPEAEIDEAIASIDRLEEQRDFAKSFNKIKDKEQRIKSLEERYPDLDQSTFSFTYPLDHGFSVTSLTTKIRERKKKIEAMKHRISNKDWSHTFNGGSMYIDNDRVIIEHEEKPEREVINQIKKHGFRYSPKTSCWVRKHTGNARWDAERLLKLWKSEEK